jgi:hypothetical protein
MLEAIRSNTKNAEVFEVLCNLAAKVVPEDDRNLFAQEVSPDKLFAGGLFSGSGRGPQPVNLLYDGLEKLKNWMENHAPVSV